MKKVMSIVLSLMLLLTLLSVMAMPVAAVKPANNLAGAQQVAWHVSADVAWVPPYGTLDIPGSDVASKLVVNQPNGVTEVTMTGGMAGLHPKTLYTVFLSNSYPQFLLWDLTGEWTLSFTDNFSNKFVHDMTIAEQTFSGALTGFGVYIPDPGVTWTMSGSTSGDDLDFVIVFTSGMPPGWNCDVEGTIAEDGTLSGTWTSSWGRFGTWRSTAGNAVKVNKTPDWPGLFTQTVQPFTFMADESGTGSWHINLRDSNFPGPGTYALSAWINEAGGTMLISDNFQVTVG